MSATLTPHAYQLDGVTFDGAWMSGRRGFGEHARRDLPVQAPAVLAPAALALLAAVADDRVPITIRFGLVNGCDLKRECPVVLDRRSAVEPEAGNS